MTLIKDVLEIEYRIKKDMKSGIAIVTTMREHIMDMPGKAYELDSISIFVRPGHVMPVMMKVTPQGTIFMPVEPVTCLVRDRAMQCDSSDEAKKNKWE